MFLPTMLDSPKATARPDFSFLNNSLDTFNLWNDQGDHYSLEVDVPGMSKNDISAEVDHEEEVLRVEGKNSKRSVNEVLSIPKNTNVEEIEARYENGTISFYLPKTKSANSKKISIK